MSVDRAPVAKIVVIANRQSVVEDVNVAGVRWCNLALNVAMEVAILGASKIRIAIVVAVLARNCVPKVTKAVQY